MHQKGEDGSNIRIGHDGNPLPGEPRLGSQQQKTLERLGKEILKKFF